MVAIVLDAEDPAGLGGSALGRGGGSEFWEGGLLPPGEVGAIAEAAADTSELGDQSGEVIAPQPLRIEAEDYVGFFDLSLGNEGGDYRDDDVDIAGVDGTYGVGWTLPGEWLTYDITVAKSGTYQLTSSVASGFDTTFSFLAGINDQSTPFTFNGSGDWQTWQDAAGAESLYLEAGRHELRIDLTSGGFSLDDFTLQWLSDEAPLPKLKIEAEDYDSAIDSSQGNIGGGYRNGDVDISGLDGQYGIGWIDPGEQLTYKLDIPEAGRYQFMASAASLYGEGAMAVSLVDELASEQSAALSIGATGGWATWQNIAAETFFDVAAGSYELRLDMLTSGFNLDNFTLSKLAEDIELEASPQQLRIQAEDYTTALDRSPGNQGGAYRLDSEVDIGGYEGSYSLGWTEQDEWLTYAVDVAKAGTFQLSAFVASAVEGQHGFQAVLANQSSVTSFGSTGGWGLSQDVAGDRLFSLEAGTYNLRLNILSGAFNLDYLELVEVLDPPGELPSMVGAIELDYGNVLNGLQPSLTAGAVNTLSYATADRPVQLDLAQGSQTIFTRDTPGELPGVNPPLKVLTLGDSITEGIMPSDLGGYRDDLWQLLNRGGDHVDFVGNRSKGIGSFDRDHGGIAGERIDQMEARVDGLLTIFEPDAILLMAGTNDLIQGADADTAAERMDSLLERITSQQPLGQIFVATIPRMYDATNNWFVQNYNAQLRSLVAAKQAAGQRITLVDQFNQLALVDLEDGVHPTPEGNGKLAAAWFGAWREVYGQTATQFVSSLPAVTTNVIGSEFDDVLVGNGADNLLEGGRGYDELTGGAGSDRFVLTLNAGTDTITDFTLGEDLLVLAGGLRYDEVDVVSAARYGYGSASDAVVIDGLGQQLARLVNVSARELLADSFEVTTF